MKFPAAILLGVILTLGTALAAKADPVAEPVAVAVAVPAAASQFYVLSFTDAPVAEVAEAVIGGALGQSVSVDPAIAGTMSFRADGWFTGEQLMQEYGTALLDRDIAMVRSRDGDLALVPRADLPRELARGAALMALVESSPGGTMPVAQAVMPASQGPAAAPIVYGQDRWWDGWIGATALLLIGALSGAAALLTGQRIAARHRLSQRVPPLTIVDRSARVAATPASEDSELVIPRFEDRHRFD